MPSTVAPWSSLARCADRSSQRTITRSFLAGSPQYVPFWERLISEPRSQRSSRYGPVPFTAETIGWSVAPGPMCASSQPVSLMANAGAAIFERNATSGAHRLKTTVDGSLAEIRLRLPV